MSSKDTRAMLIDMELALQFGRSVNPHLVVQRAARKMRAVGYRGCERTLDILATHRNPFTIWGQVRKAAEGVI